MYELMIQNQGTIYLPMVEDGIVWETERRGSPGKLSFSVVKDGKLNIQEGNPVSLRKDGIDVFYGFIFSKQRSKDGLIQVTAYDQLRYLKNKDTVRDVGRKASELLQMLAADFHLRCGTVEDSGYVIESIVEEDQSLFDMILNAVDETVQATGNLFVLYDDFGKICLRNIKNMKRDFLVDCDVTEDIDYTSSIDKQTYNKIKLTYENEEKGEREVFVAQDGSHINLWGVLQYHETLKGEIGAAEKANVLLRLYNQKTRCLTVKNVLGDVSVRAGTLVPVHLNLGDMIAKTYMLVDRARHTFKENLHLMELILIGGEFIA